MERPEIYTDNYNSLEEWIELRKRNEEFVYPQFFVPFREWMKDIEQKSDMEIKELLRILLQPYTLGVDTVDTYEFYKEYVQDKVNKEKNLQTYELCMNQLKYNERIYRIKNKQEAWEGLTWVLPLLNINPMKALKALGMYFDAECIYMPDDRIYGISDNDHVEIISGGTNYYPFNPDNDSIEDISKLLEVFSETEPYYQVSLRLVKEILAHIIPSPDFKLQAFCSVIDTILSEHPTGQGILIVRRERNVAQGTGALLSPNDWQLGGTFSDKVVLTMYQVTGTKGWNGKKLWVPNIKLPSNTMYYDVIEEDA